MNELVGLEYLKQIGYLDGFQYTYRESSTCLWCKTEVAFEQQAFKTFDPLPTILQWDLDFVPTAEGFYSFTENHYIYQYRDHLGNVRVSFGKNSEGVQETTDTNNYYPFGLNHIGGTGYAQLGSYFNYKYNGKELQETGMYDYGARMYMPDLGRWSVIDPLTEMYQPFSSYNYVLNNPISNIDPDGREVKNDYQLLKNGEVKLIKETQDKSDTLYASDKNGNVNTGKSITVNKAEAKDATIISQLETNVDGKQRYGTTTNGTDARKVFQFGAENTNVEWSIGGFDTKGKGTVDKYLVGTSGVTDKVTAPWAFGEKGLTFDNVLYAGHTHPFTRMPQPHDNNISKPGIYNFIYYTGAGYGDKQRENYFVPYWLRKDEKTGKNIATPKSNYRSIKLPNLIP